MDHILAKLTPAERAKLHQNHVANSIARLKKCEHKRRDAANYPVKWELRFQGRLDQHIKMMASRNTEASGTQQRKDSGGFHTPGSRQF